MLFHTAWCPEGLQGDYDASVTFRQYSQMLTNLIRIWDESRLGEWEEIIALAAESDEEMQREDGILATAYAMVLMGQNAPGTDSLHLDIDQIMEQLPGEIDTPSWDYPLFPSWEEMGFRVVQQQLYVGRCLHLRYPDLPGQRPSYLSL